MSFYPDGRLCVVTIEIEEELPESRVNGLLGRFFASDEDTKTEERRKGIVLRNKNRLRDANASISEAKKQRYKAVISIKQKNQIAILGVKSNLRTWTNYTVNDLLNDDLYDETRNLIANMITRPNNCIYIKNWDKILSNYSNY